MTTATEVLTTEPRFTLAACGRWIDTRGVLALTIVLAIAARAWNIFGYPEFSDDEGTYVAQERVNENDLMAVTCLMSLVEVWRGDLPEAAHLADEAMERAEQGGGTLAFALTMRAMVGRLRWART